MKDIFPHLLCPTPGIMDVAVSSGKLCLVRCDGKFEILTLEGEKLSELDKLGDLKTITVSNDIAALAAYEDGLWFLDISGDAPKLLSHYRTVGFASDVTLSGGHAFVSCGSYGVEIVDITTPTEPRFLSTVRGIGEVRSCTVDDGRLFCGCYGECKTVILNISDLTNIRVIAELPLGGCGDGLCVKDGKVYAATGHNARGIGEGADPKDPLYGNGNGIEVYDISLLPSFRRARRFEFGYGNLRPDATWKADADGVIVCSASSLGVYGFDPLSFEPIFHLAFPSADDPVTGTDAIDGKLFITTAKGGVWCFEDERIRETCRGDVPVSEPVPTERFRTDGRSLSVLEPVYEGGFPIAAAAELGMWIALACVDGGIRLVDPFEYKEVSVTPTPDACLDLAVHGDRLFAALANGGMGIYKLENAALTPLCLLPLGGPAGQITVDSEGETVAVALGCQDVLLFDVRDPEHPSLLSRDEGKGEPLSFENFLPHHPGAGTVSYFRNRTGLMLANPSHDSPDFIGLHYTRKDGFCDYSSAAGCDSAGGQVLFGYGGGYVFLPFKDGSDLDECEIIRADRPFHGRFSILNDRLFVTDRARGTLTVLDFSDFSAPRTVAAFRTTAPLGRTVFIRGHYYLPAWRSGLIEYRETPASK